MGVPLKKGGGGIQDGLHLVFNMIKQGILGLTTEPMPEIQKYVCNLTYCVHVHEENCGWKQRQLIQESDKNREGTKRFLHLNQQKIKPNEKPALKHCILSF